jgi:hypothetical protein
MKPGVLIPWTLVVAALFCATTSQAAERFDFLYEFGSFCG